MEAQKSVAGVCALLDKLSNLDADKIAEAAKAEEARLIRTIEPAPELITPMVPDFVSSHLALKAGGKAVMFLEAAEAWAEEHGAALTGPTGSGKTTIIKAFVDWVNSADLAHNRKVWERNKAKALAKADHATFEPYRPVRSLKVVQGSEETCTADLIGGTGLSYDKAGNRRIEEMLGAGVEAYTLGLPLLVDEADAIPAGVTSSCHGIFDRNSQTVQVWLNGRKEYRRHPDFSVSFTMNTKGFGENAAEYGHAQIQSRALFTRISYMLEVGYMEEAAEVALVKARVGEVPDAAVIKMVQAAGRIRKAYIGGAIDLVVSTREVEAWAREVRRAIRRGVSVPNDVDLWNKVVVPAAGPTICVKTADKGTVEAVMKELSWR
jgi:MoxR-like ATPase